MLSTNSALRSLVRIGLAFIVLVKTGHLISDVLMPVFEGVDPSVQLPRFSAQSEFLDAGCDVLVQGDKWEITKTIVR